MPATNTASIRATAGSRLRRTLLAPESLRHQHAQRLYTVAPLDLLALGLRPGLEANGQLLDAVAALQEPGGDLGLDFEAAGCQTQRSRDVGSHDLVAGLHVRQRRPEEYVRRGGQCTIGRDGHKRRVWNRPQKPRPVNDRRPPCKNGLDEG